VAHDPHRALRRLSPDPVQFQVIIGSLLGDARIVGGPFDQWLTIGHRIDRAAYVWWNCDRLGALAAEPQRSAMAGSPSRPSRIRSSTTSPPWRESGWSS
jgi:hypothetical protein